MLNIWRRPLPTPINTIQRQHCDQMNPAPPRSSVSSGIRGGRRLRLRAEDRSLPLSVLRFLSWQSDGNRSTVCLGRGETQAPCQLWKRDGGQRGKQERERVGVWQWDHRGPKACFCFWPLYASPGRRGRQSKALSSHQAAQGAQNRKHETDRNRYSVNTVFTGNMREAMTHFCG